MSIKMPLIQTGSCIAWMIVAIGCGSSSPTKPTDGMLVFAAASTIDAFDELKSLFEKRHAVHVRVNYAGSSTLAQQILNGAQPDLLISANKVWADTLTESGLVDQRQDLLSNQLVVIVPSDSEFLPKRLEELASAAVQRVAIADPDSVPAGIYAKQALNESGIWEQVQKKLIVGVHVRHVLSHVEQGGAEVGIVYATDAAISDSVAITARIDPALTEPIRYPILLFKTAAKNRDARKLYAFLTSDEAAHVFSKFGFLVVE